MDAFGYREGIKEAKRLISEGRAQLESAHRLEHYLAGLNVANLFCGSGHDKLIEEECRAFEKKSDAIGKIQQGLEAYAHLLSYENLDHFARIKNGIKGALKEFEYNLSKETVERYTNCLYVGPE